jgi:hypothetical protein
MNDPNIAGTLDFDAGFVISAGSQVDHISKKRHHKG